MSGSGAVLDLQDGRYLACVWFASKPGADWMASLYRDAEGPWVLCERFRVDGEGGNDTRIARSSRAPTDLAEQDAICAVDGLAANVARIGFKDLSKVPIGSDRLEAIVDVLSRQPWCHIKSLATAEA